MTALNKVLFKFFLLFFVSISIGADKGIDHYNNNEFKKMVCDSFISRDDTHRHIYGPRYHGNHTLVIRRDRSDSSD